MGFISASGTGCAARTRAWGISATGLWAAAAALLALLPHEARAGALEIGFEGLRSAKGVLRVCLTASADHFPDCSKDSRAITRTISAASPRLVLADVPEGEFAISAIHDENGNGRLDTFAGIPREGIGFSGNPRIRFGPPRFAAARFSMGEATVSQQIRLRYFL